MRNIKLQIIILIAFAGISLHAEQKTNQIRNLRGAWAKVSKAGDSCGDFPPLLLFNNVKGRLVVIVYTGDHSLTHSTLIAEVKDQVIRLKYKRGKDDVLRIKKIDNDTFIVENQVFGFTGAEELPMPTWPPRSVFARCDLIDIERDFANIWSEMRR